MMGEYDLGKILSAVITLLAIGVAVRVYLNYVKSKGAGLQKPDWLKDREKKY